MSERLVVFKYVGGKHLPPVNMFTKTLLAIFVNIFLETDHAVDILEYSILQSYFRVQ